MSVINVTPTSATVTWGTSELATSKVYYSTTSTVSTSSPAVENTTLVLSHSLNLTGLSASTTYYYLVESKDAAGNTSLSSVGNFTTPSVDITAPSISAITTTDITSSGATVNWMTNENATSKVYYSTASPVDFGTALSVSNSSFVTAHSLNLSSLSASTTYYFVVESSDGSSNRATSTQNSFTTLPPPDTTAPIISNVVAGSVSSTSATITWTTDENATSKVYYSLSTPVNLGTASVTEVAGLTMAHSVGLSGLTASSTYYFIVESKDAVSNTGTSSQSSLTTTP